MRRRRVFGIGAAAGLLLSGAASAVAIFFGGAVPVAIVITAVGSLLGGALGLTMDEQLRNPVPTEEQLKRGLSAFQIDGGRMPPLGEKPPRKYWDFGSD